MHVEMYEQNKWCTERGAIQLGYTNNVGWSFIYLKNFLLCTACTYNAITTAKKLITLISKVNLYFHNIKHEHSN